ncbi:MAG: purine-nucleoside phosphorylase [Trueperaceae bacterium]
MSQLHIHAQAGDIAPWVLLPGDPNRATFIAETFLDSARLYNDNRQLLGYTGTFRGVPVSVQTTGMGCPSLAIVVEELIRLGAKTLIRVGTAGIISPAVAPGDLIIASAAVPADGTTRQYLNGLPSAPGADFTVTRALADAGTGSGTDTRAGASADTSADASDSASGGTGSDTDAGTNARSGVHLGLIRTEDAFYATSPEDVPELRRQGVLAVEMEASALFLLGQLRGVATGCILAASNAIGDSSFVEASVMRTSVSRMVERALAACLLLQAASGGGDR